MQDWRHNSVLKIHVLSAFPTSSLSYSLDVYKIWKFNSFRSQDLVLFIIFFIVFSLFSLVSLLKLGFFYAKRKMAANKMTKNVICKKRSLEKQRFIWRPSHHAHAFSGYPQWRARARTKLLCPSKLGIFMTVFSSWPDWSMVLVHLAHISLSPHSDQWHFLLLFW